MYDPNATMKKTIMAFPLWVIKILCFLFNLLWNNIHDEEVKTDKLMKNNDWSLIIIAKTQTEKVSIVHKNNSLNSVVKGFLNKESNNSIKTKTKPIIEISTIFSIW